MKTFYLCFFFLTGLALAQPDYQTQTERLSPELESLYRWFHAHPEESYKEEKTSERLAAELEKLGLEVHTGIGGHGLMAILKSGREGPVVLYRADMDGLPVTEATGLPYASQNPGVMHACGHDIHMTCAIGTLSVMSRLKDHWRGTIVFVGQPAEEMGAGAGIMMADPRFAQVLDSVGRPEAALALHDYPSIPAGSAALTSGFVTANVDSVDITMLGRGGHGAAPETTIDPVVMGAEVVTALQTIVSRSLTPGTRAVVTVGRFEAGTKRNIIPPEARLELTIRSYEEETRQKILSELERIARGVAQAHGAPEPVFYHHADAYTPASFNDPTTAERLRPVFVEVLGEDNLRELPPSMVGEDFSRYSKDLKIPGVMFLLGAANPQAFVEGKELPPLHSDKFAPDYPLTLKTGVNLTVASLLELLK
ncbi:MAG: amidohydrolase [Vulcanimicrobiota bacterium]